MVAGTKVDSVIVVIAITLTQRNLLANHLRYGSKHELIAKNVSLIPRVSRSVHMQKLA
jgi:hypothetical protein